MVLVDVETTVTPAGHEEVAVLRQVPREPDRRLVRLLAEVREARRRVLRAHVVQPEFRLKGRDHQLQSGQMGGWREMIEGGERV